METKRGKQKNMPRNPSAKEVSGLNRNWNENNIYIPGVRIVTKDYKQFYLKQKMGAVFMQVYSVFLEIINKAVVPKRV